MHDEIEKNYWPSLVHWSFLFFSRLVQELQKGVSLAEAVSKLDKQFELKINEDLNKLPTEELEIQKQLMEALFLKNQIKKDDSDFVYDKRLDFPGEKTESNWDSETDDKFWI